MAAPTALHCAATDLRGPEALFESLQREELQVVELYTEWAGPTAACKSAWRKLALEHGGALPVDLSTACLERCSAPGGPLAEHKATSEPSFLLFKGGTEVACVQGVDIPALMAALATHSAAAGPHGSTAAETEAGSEPAHGA